MSKRESSEKPRVTRSAAAKCDDKHNNEAPAAQEPSGDNDVPEPVLGVTVGDKAAGDGAQREATRAGGTVVRLVAAADTHCDVDDDEPLQETVYCDQGDDSDADELIDPCEPDDSADKVPTAGILARRRMLERRGRTPRFRHWPHSKGSKLKAAHLPDADVRFLYNRSGNEVAVVDNYAYTKTTDFRETEPSKERYRYRCREPGTNCIAYIYVDRRGRLLCAMGEHTHAANLRKYEDDHTAYEIKMLALSGKMRTTQILDMYDGMLPVGRTSLARSLRRLKAGANVRLKVTETSKEEPAVRGASLTDGDAGGGGAGRSKPSFRTPEEIKRCEYERRMSNRRDDLLSVDYDSDGDEDDEIIDDTPAERHSECKGPQQKRQAHTRGSVQCACCTACCCRHRCSVHRCTCCPVCECTHVCAVHGSVPAPPTAASAAIVCDDVEVDVDGDGGAQTAEEPLSPYDDGRVQPSAVVNKVEEVYNESGSARTRFPLQPACDAPDVRQAIIDGNRRGNKRRRQYSGGSPTPSEDTRWEPSAVNWRDDGRRIWSKLPQNRNMLALERKDTLYAHFHDKRVTIMHRCGASGWYNCRHCRSFQVSVNVSEATVRYSKLTEDEHDAACNGGLLCHLAALDIEAFWFRECVDNGYTAKYALQVIAADADRQLISRVAESYACAEADMHYIRDQVTSVRKMTDRLQRKKRKEQCRTGNNVVLHHSAFV